MTNFTPAKSRNALSFFPRNEEELIEALYECYIMARRGKLRTRDEHNFEINYMENIDRLARSILCGTYQPSRGKAFITHKPVIREIFAAPFRDRVVHHLLFALNGLWWDGQLINDSYSCRVGKGTLYGIQRMQKFMQEAILEYPGEQIFVVMRDLSGFFMSIPRREVFKVVCEGLDKQFSYPRDKWIYGLCRQLWFETLFDDPTDRVKMAGGKKEWEPLPKNKSLFFQPPEQGIVIGNLTSQSVSNTYLNQFDRFMKYDLGFKYYGRYVDDFFIIVPESQLAVAQRLLETEAKDKLGSMGLTIHPKKKYCQPVWQGAPFLGQYVHPFYTTPGKRIRGNFYKAARAYMMGLRNDETIISYLGMGKHASQRKLNAKIFAAMGWEYNW